LQPRTSVGVDYATKAVALSKAHACLEGLYFLAGDAEWLPLRSGTFDAVINVESSHCYRSLKLFLDEVRRVLRPGGYFLYADFRDRRAIAEWCDQLERTGFALVKKSDITANVVAALNCDNARRLDFIQKKMPRFLQKPFREFAGVQGSRIYRRLLTGEATYISFVFRKYTTRAT